MELEDQSKSDLGLYFCYQPLVAFEKDTVSLEGNCDPYYNIWMDTERAVVKSCNNRSFAADARLRLESLKSGYNSALTRWTMDSMLDSCRDHWDGEQTQEEESALDSVELLEVGEDTQDEENWLYQPPKRQLSEDRGDSALRWCRHVLDNPSPETATACRSLINRLDQGKNFYRHPVALPHSGNGSVGSFSDQIGGSWSFNKPESTDDNQLSVTSGATISGYKLQDITDVHIMARLQEASLRQDYFSAPPTASTRGTVPPTLVPSIPIKDSDEFTTGGLSWKSAPSALNSHAGQSLPTAVSKQGCQSPRLSRLHQQVTQFKLLKLAQKQATSPGTSRSPLGTSLRSLQAVRNSRSLETDDYQPADSQTTYPASAPRGSHGFLRSLRDSLDRASAVKRVQRSQSASPCRIPNPAKVHLSMHGRVYASPERSTAVAWTRGVAATRR
ncbi:SLAIN motif-containing protein-like [Nelusetta ayraudi]|uniref:SLAIN motif-containing protein-like n=1 Tax=Nelusetta ayraudi TaxID=303726 RepID=UPI003F6F17F1